MLNIKMQICGLVILAAIFIFLTYQRNLHLHQTRIFKWILAISIVSLVLDIMSVIAIIYEDIFGQILMDVICKGYLVTLTFSGWCSYVYMMYKILDKKRYKKFVTYTALVTIALNIIAVCLPIRAFWDGTNLYTEGPCTKVMYCIALIYIVCILYSVLRHKKELNSSYRLTMIFWDVIIVICTLIQYMFKEVLLLGFGISIGCLIIYAVLENPQSMIDKSFGCFNSYAIYAYIDNLYEQDKDFCMEEINFDEDVDRSKYVLFKDLCMQIHKTKNAFIFYAQTNQFVIIAEDTCNLDDINEKYVLPFIKNNNFTDKSNIVLFEKGRELNNTKELKEIFEFIDSSLNVYSGKVNKFSVDAVLQYRENNAIIDEIDKALDEDRVEVFYQPIYSFEKNAFVSAEALCRIRKKDGRLLSPGIFIPIAEKSGRINRLGERVIRKTCELFIRHNLKDLGIDYIEINLSVVQCEDRNFVPYINNLIDSYGLEHKIFNWEITETASITEMDVVLDNMRRLVENDYRFSLDDFGKGESNLMYIVDMPVSLVKMDIDLTKAYFESPKAKEVVRSVIRMAHKLKLKVVCEGVEQESEAEALFYENVDYIQGYYYSRPLPKEDFIGLISKNKN